MSERQVLIDWLAQAARRLRWHQLIGVLTWVTFWLLVLLLAYQTLRAVVPVPAVLGGLRPLLVLGAVGVVAWAMFSIWQRPSLADAAFAADRAGKWHDQLKSAYWFSRQAPSDGLARHDPMDAGVAVLLARARTTLAGADLRSLFPWRTTPVFYGVIGVAVLSVLLAWWSPRVTYSETGTGDASARAWRGDKPAPGSATLAEGRGESAGQANARGAPAGRGSAGTSPQAGSDAPLDRAASEAGGGDESAQAGRPVAIVTEESPSRTDVPAERRTARNTPSELPSEWLGGVVERLKEMMQKGDLEGEGESLSPPGDGKGEARVNASESGSQRDLGSSDPNTEMRNADNGGGSQLNLNALGGIGPRNTLPGDVAGEEQSGRNNNRNSGPMGRRINTSRGGAGDDTDAPMGDPGGESKSPEVLGKKTARLALQLRRVPSPTKSDAKDAEQEQSAPEDFFAATRSQAARTAATAGAVLNTSAAPVDALAAEQTPLAYRAAVKGYFLSQHRKEK